MAWGWRRGGRWLGPWPGRGPFSYLPPWQRPGWLYGFGRRWGYLYNPWIYNPWAYAMFPWWIYWP